MRFSSKSGQAVVEYLVVFSVMAVIAVSLVKALNGYMGSTMGSLGYHLSEELSSGVCRDLCFFEGFRNW